MLFLLSLLFSSNFALSKGMEWVNMPKATPIYVKAEEGANILMMTTEGEQVGVRHRGNKWTLVQVKRGKKLKVGYIHTSDLDRPQVFVIRGRFGFGGGGMYSYLRHAGRDFETEDQVQYSTEEFVSGTFSPFLMVQFNEKDFWRFIFAYRLTEYSSSATTDVPGGSSRDLSLEHTMYSVTIQKMWTPFLKPFFYYGLGFEVSKASEANLVLGGNRLPVASEDLPTYLGGHAVAGGQLDVSPRLSAFAEFRFTGYFNQSPLIMGAEVALGLLFWP